MNFNIYDQNNNVLFSKDLQEGWNYIGSSLGVHVTPTGVRITNGVYDGDSAGGIFFSKIIITDITPKLDILPKAWKYSNGTLEIGSGQEYFPARGVMIIWRDHQYNNITLDKKIGSVSIQGPSHATIVSQQLYAEGQALTSAVRNGTAGPSLPSPLGCWQPYGETQPGGPGGWGIGPITPEIASTLPVHYNKLLILHSHTMQRMALDCRSYVNGLPIKSVAVDGYYSLSRGWNKTGQLPRFGTLTPNETRAPIDINTGVCSYRAKLLGLNMWDGYLPYDGQHLIRGTQYAKLLYESFGNEIALMDLETIHTDNMYAWSGYKTAIVNTQHVGSTYWGRRESAWVVDTAKYFKEPVTGTNLGTIGALKLCAVQMPNGGMMRCTSGGPESQGFSPDPWMQGMPTNMDVEQSMERWLAMHALACNDQWREALACVDTVFSPGPFTQSLPSKLGYVPKWFAVGTKGGAPTRRPLVGVGGADYFPWVALGAAASKAIHDGKDPTKYLSSMLTIPTPTQGKATNYTDLLSRLERDWTGRFQTVAAISALRKYL